MCRMKQDRTCSTGNTTDCEGISVRQAACDEHLCPGDVYFSYFFFNSLRTFLLENASELDYIPIHSQCVNWIAGFGYPHRNAR
jgi:hypothetical protein